jgi:tetratricopeptide (TPR) repeat protein
MAAKQRSVRPRYIGLLAALVLASTPAHLSAQSALPPDAQAEVLFQKARAILSNTSIPERERFLQASDVFREYWKLPENVKTLPAMSLNAEILFRLGDFQSAQVVLTEFLKKSNAQTPDRGRMAALYAEVEPLAALQKQNDALAIEQCNRKMGKEKVIEGCTYIIEAGWRSSKKSVAWALSNRALARPLTDFNRLRDLEAATKIEPPDSRSFYLLGLEGLAFVSTKEALERSIANLERSMEISGKRQPFSLYYIANKLFEMRHLDPSFTKRAFDYIDESIKTSPRDLSSRTMTDIRLRGMIARELGNYAQSIADLEYVVSVKGGEASYFYPHLLLTELGVSQFLAGNEAAARKTFERYRAETPDTDSAKPIPLYKISPSALAFGDAGKFDLAEREYDLAFANTVDERHLLALAKGACTMHGRWAKYPERGLAYCNDVLSRDPASEFVHEYRANLHAKLGNWTAALADFEQALKSTDNPYSTAKLQYGRGLAHIKLGRAKQGQADIIAALGARPDVVDEFRKIGIVE